MKQTTELLTPLYDRLRESAGRGAEEDGQRDEVAGCGDGGAPGGFGVAADGEAVPADRRAVRPLGTGCRAGPGLRRTTYSERASGVK